MQDVSDMFAEILEVLGHEPQRRKDIHGILKGTLKMKKHTLKQKYNISLARLSGILDMMIMCGLIVENEKTRLLEKTSLGETILELMQRGTDFKKIVQNGAKLSKVK